MRSRHFLVVMVIAAMLGEGLAVGAATIGIAGAAPLSSTRTWAIESTPNIAGGSQNALLDVSCTSKQHCVGVGYSYSPDIFHVLAEVWDGLSWSIQPTPTLPGLGGQLSAVTCTSKRDCIAVGGRSTTPGTTFGGTLAEIWDGHAWTIQQTSNPTGAPNSALAAVSCTSKNNCVAVGSSVASGGGPEVTLAEVWDGHAWTIQPTPNPTGASTTTLLAVSCASARACTAVGYSTNALTSVAASFVEVWNGYAWVIQSTPDPVGSPFTQLDGVSCTSATACIAVGYSFTPLDATVDSLTEAWDGHAWTIQPTPNPNRNILEGVSCTSPMLCTAVGFSNAGGFVMTLAEVWNGQMWADEATPNPTDASAILSGVSCISEEVCAAVGFTQSASATLAEGSSRSARVRINRPDAPTAVVAKPGFEFISVSWTAPASDGGSSILYYVVSATHNGTKTCTTPGPTATGPTACTVIDLIGGHEYIVRVRAVNAVGQSPTATTATTATTTVFLPNS
jgi:hypothetical protein